MLKVFNQIKKEVKNSNPEASNYIVLEIAKIIFYSEKKVKPTFIIGAEWIFCNSMEKVATWCAEQNDLNFAQLNACWKRAKKENWKGRYNSAFENLKRITYA